MDNRFAVIDLGSNTFHILIVDLSEDGSFSQVHKQGVFVSLAEKGIEIIGEQAVERGIKALKEFSTLMAEYKVKNYLATGTSALRSASNGQRFIEKALLETGIVIKVIDGSREAELIYKGVSLVSQTSHGNHFIMDIGGGSVEFILVANDKLVWAKSFDIGIGVLYNLKQLSDPISAEDILELNSFLDERLIELRGIVFEKNIDSMIGASGSFEIIQSIIGDKVSSTEESEINLKNYFQISKIIRKSNSLERESMEGLPAHRVKLIAVAFLLIDKAIEIINPSRMMVSPYALKEGVLSELTLNNKR